MTPLEIAFLVALVGLGLFALYLAGFVSWHVAHADYFSPGQRYAQYAIIWLIPILGAALVLHVLSPEIRARRPGWVPWFDYLLFSAFVSSATGTMDDAANPDAHDVDTPTPDGGGND